MTRMTLLVLVALVLGACSLCPDGYRQAPNAGAYGFVKCEKE